MATEQDVYTIDTTGAVSGMEAARDATKKTGEALDDTKKKSESFGAQLDKLGDDLTRRYLSVNAAVGAIKAVGEWLVDSVKAYNDAAREEQRWQLAMQMAGVTSRSLTTALRDQAEAFEAATGTQGESVLQMQALLAQMGVAPKLLLETADAALRLANATGQDATSAARALANAYTHNSDELKKYGINVDDATFKQKGFSAVLEQVKERFPEVTATIPPQVQRLNELRKAWDDFGKSVGQAITNSAQIGTLTEGWAGALKTASSVINQGIGTTFDKIFNADKYQKQFSNLASRYQETLDRAGGIQRAFFAGGERDGAQYAASLQTVQDELATLQARAEKLGAGRGIQLANLFGGDAALAELEKIKQQMQGVLDFSDDGTDVVGKKRSDKVVKTLDQRFAAARAAFEKGRQQSLADAQRFADLENEIEISRIEKQRDLNITAGLADLARIRQHEADVLAVKQSLSEATLGPLRGLFESALTIAEEGDAAMLAEVQRSALAVSANWEQMKNDALGWGQQMLQGFGSYLADQLTSNTKFNQQMFELQVKRETAGMSESEAAKKRADMERQMSEDRAASFLKMTEDMLAQIAVQAGIKAIWEVGEGIAAFASYRYAEGTQHMIAAGIYTGVAVAAGGTAAIIASSRPMTSDERQQLDSQKEQNAQTVGSGASGPSGGTAQAAAPQQVVNQYIIGIAGMTEQQQGQELSRIQDQFNNQRTGGG